MTFADGVQTLTKTRAVKIAELRLDRYQVYSVSTIYRIRKQGADTLVRMINGSEITK